MVNKHSSQDYFLIEPEIKKIISSISDKSDKEKVSILLLSVDYIIKNKFNIDKYDSLLPTC